MAGLKRRKSGNNVSSKFSTYPCGEVGSGPAAGETRPLGAQRAARSVQNDCGYGICPVREGSPGEIACRLRVAFSGSRLWWIFAVNGNWFRCLKPMHVRAARGLAMHAGGGPE